MNDKKLKKSWEKITNLSELKLQLKNVLGNLKELVEVQQGTQQWQQQPLKAITEQTDAMLLQLEQTPIHKFVSITKQRRRKRRVASKNKSKRQKGEVTKLAVSDLAQSTGLNAVMIASTDEQFEKTLAATSTQQSHQKRLNYNDAQRILRSLELLKILNLARTQNLAATQQFSTHFEQLRAIWNCVLHENEPQRSHERKIEHQWNQVFFGASEQTYYSQELKLNDFLRIRQTWDSYLTNSSPQGSSIPLGWVLPTEKANTFWTPYKSK